METKNYAKNSEKWDFSTISATIFSPKKRSNCSLNTLANLATDWYSAFWFFTDASCQTCQSCQTHFGNLSNPLINYIFKIYNYIRALTDFSFSVWQVWQLWQLCSTLKKVWMDFNLNPVMRWIISINPNQGWIYVRLHEGNDGVRIQWFLGKVIINQNPVIGKDSVARIVRHFFM